jgi:hypothetical protein
MVTETTNPLVVVIEQLAPENRTPQMEADLQREYAKIHRANIINGALAWLRDSGQAKDFKGRAGVKRNGRPRTAWLRFNRTASDRFRYGLYFTVSMPYTASLWISAEDTDEHPPRRGWHLIQFFKVDDVLSGAELMEAAMAIVDSASMDVVYRWLDGEPENMDIPMGTSAMDADDYYEPGMVVGYAQG